MREVDHANHTLHIDIAGPFAVSDDGFTCFLVGALRMPGFPLVIDVHNLISRTSTEVCDELEKTVASSNHCSQKALPQARLLESNDYTVTGQESSLHLTLPDFLPTTRQFTTLLPQAMTLKRMELLRGQLASSNPWHQDAFAQLRWKELTGHTLFATRLSLSFAALYNCDRSLTFWHQYLCTSLRAWAVRFPQPRSLTARLLFRDHLHDSTSYILCPPEDDVSDPLVQRASLPARLLLESTWTTWLDCSPYLQSLHLTTF